MEEQIYNILLEIKELLQGILAVLFFLPTVYLLSKFVYKVLE